MVFWILVHLFMLVFDMKKFSINILFVLLLLCTVDYVLGYAFDHLKSSAKYGTTKRSNYILQETNEDILIFGSSRAARHYDPHIIEDLMGLKCYNCGMDGCGIILAYANLQAIVQRYTPKAIVYELTPNFDFVEGDNVKYIKSLRPYYDNPVISAVINDIDEVEKYKCLSKMYRYNMMPTTLIHDNLLPSNEYEKGFEPVRKKLTKEPAVNMDYTVKKPSDPLKLRYLDSLILLCKERNISLVFSISPVYRQSETRDAFEPGKLLAKYHNIPILDNSNLSEISGHLLYFSDAIHLNYEGAMHYTRIFSNQLKDLWFNKLSDNM